MADLVYTLEKPQETFDRRSSPLSLSSDSSTEFACVSCIDDTILPPQRKLPDSIAMKLSNAGRILAIITLVCTVTITGFGFFTSNDSGSSAMFGFAFDSFFGLISACILIWRFSFQTHDSYTIAKRETHATAVVAICMIVSSIATFVRAVNYLYHTHRPRKPIELLILTAVSLFIYSILFVAKYSVAQKLGSGSLMTDAMDSFSGALFALSILGSAIVLKFTTKVWFLDSTIAVVVSVCSFIYGIIVIEKLVRVFRKREEKALREYEYQDLKDESNDEDCFYEEKLQQKQTLQQ